MVGKVFIKLAKANIISCRPGDWNHALRVVYRVKQLINEETQNTDLIIAAAYIHDIGWKNIIPSKQKSISKDELLKYESQANKNTIPFATKFLSELNYSKMQIGIILDLIKAVDERKSNNIDEAVIVDADNLSKLNIDHVREKYDKNSWPEIYNLFETVLPNIFKTKLAKKIYPDLLMRLKTEIDQNLK